MKFTKIPVTTFQKLVLNAGIICKNFDVNSGEFANQIGATSGGSQFSATPSFSDFGDDIDNCPKNMMELKHLDSWDVTLSGTLLTVDIETAKLLIAACDAAGNKITPRRDVKVADFNDLWLVCDYSDENDGSNAGFIAIHLLNALNTGGFSLQSANNGKGTFSFTFTGHVSMNAQDVVPFEVYIKTDAEPTPYITLDKHNLTIGIDDEVTLGYEVYPAGSTVTFNSSASGKASVSSAGVVKGLEAGSTTITASITVESIAYTDTCTVVVEDSEG